MAASTTSSDRAGAWGALPAFTQTLMRLLGRRVVAALVLAVALGLGEGVGFLLLVPLLGAVGLEISSGSVGTLARFVSRLFAVFSLQPTLATVLVAYAVVMSVQSALSRWQLVTVLSVEHRFAAALRKQLYAAVARARWPFLARTRASAVAHVLTHEVERTGFATYQALSLVVHVCVAAVYLALAVRLSPIMTGGVVIAGAIVLAALHQQYRSARVQGERVSRSTDQLFTAAVEHVAALRIAKSYGAEERHVASLATVSDEVAAAQVGAIEISAGARSRFEIGGVTALCLLLWIGLRELAMPPGGVLLLLYVYARIMPRMSALQQGLQNVAFYLPSFVAVERMRLDAEAERETEQLSSPAPLSYEREITIEGLTFLHDPGTAAGIRDVSMAIPFGSMVAIVGASGAGKSTFADLLSGLYRPQQGTIRVDGVELDDTRTADWKRQIGYVNQDTFFFNDTARANLLWANPSATDADIRSALQLAAAEFVFDLPQQLETPLGDRGQRLSGGERQRLALARALLRQPTLLLLDEATSALDLENEARILATIRQLRRSMSVVLITHRVSAVHDADVVHLFDAGRLVASGDWDSLSHRLAGRPALSALEVP